MKLSNRGISLIQVILTAAFLSVAALTGIKLMRLQIKVAKSTATRFEISYLLNEMTEILSDPLSCKATFDGLLPTKQKNAISYLTQEIVDPESNNTIRLKWYETFGTSQKLYGNQLLKIQSYSLSDQAQEVDLSQGSTNLEINLDRGSDALGSQFIRKSIRLNIQLENGRIRFCRAVRNPPSREEKNSPWQWDKSGLNLSYQQGNIGIKTLPSKASLSIRGSLMLLPTSETTCDQNNQGALRHEEKSGLIKVCHSDGNWHIVGNNQISNLPPKTYQLISNGLQEQSLSLGTHKFCYLNSIKRRGLVQCSLQKRDESWLLTSASPQGDETFECKVSCYH